MERKTATIDLKGKQYAQVKDRILEFRKANPRGKIQTTPEFMPDGQVHFTAYILVDKADETSADATGHSFGPNKGEKSFEKLETIAVGRALALLGYASDGEIASSEEMEEFEEFQEEKNREMILTFTEDLTACKTLEELQAVWVEMPPLAKGQLLALKDDLKAKLSKAGKPKGKKQVEIEPTEEQIDSALEQAGV